MRDGGKDLKEKQDFFSNVYSHYLCILVIGASFIISASQIFTRILLADAYYESWQYIPVLTLATMFSALSSFMGSVYFLEKKSVYSMLTALTGALVNIVLNFAMIPDHGAMGAAVATLISYLTVYAVRVVDTRRYVIFNTHNLKLLINTALLILQGVVMLVDVWLSFYASIGILLLLAVLNLKGIIASIAKILGFFIKKEKNN